MTPHPRRRAAVGSGPEHSQRRSASTRIPTDLVRPYSLLPEATVTRYPVQIRIRQALACIHTYRYRVGDSMHIPYRYPGTVRVASILAIHCARQMLNADTMLACIAVLRPERCRTGGAVGRGSGDTWRSVAQSLSRRRTGEAARWRRGGEDPCRKEEPRSQVARHPEDPVNMDGVQGSELLRVGVLKVKAECGVRRGAIGLRAPPQSLSVSRVLPRPTIPPT